MDNKKTFIHIEATPEGGHDYEMSGQKIDVMALLMELFTTHPSFYEVVTESLEVFEDFKKTDKYQKVKEDHEAKAQTSKIVTDEFGDDPLGLHSHGQEDDDIEEVDTNKNK